MGVNDETTISTSLPIPLTMTAPTLDTVEHVPCGTVVVDGWIDRALIIQHLFTVLPSLGDRAELADGWNRGSDHHLPRRVQLLLQRHKVVVLVLEDSAFRTNQPLAGLTEEFDFLVWVLLTTQLPVGFAPPPPPPPCIV